MIHEMSHLEMYEDRGSNSAAHDVDYDNSDGRATCSTNSGHYGVPLGTKYPNG